MMRFYRHTAIRIWFCLLYIKCIAKISMKEVVASVLANARGNPDVNPLLLDWIDDSAHFLQTRSPVAETLDDILITFTNFVMNKGRPASDRDLIDTVVEMLKLPFATNGRLTTDHIRQLQRAILVPNELTLLKESLRKTELCCTTCKRAFETSELTTFEMGPNGPRFYCYRCMHPTRVAACTTCKNAIDIDNTFYIGKVVDCQQHKKVAEVAPPPPPSDSIPRPWTRSADVSFRTALDNADADLARILEVDEDEEDSGDDDL